MKPLVGAELNPTERIEHPETGYIESNERYKCTCVCERIAKCLVQLNPKERKP